jgi:hypothetical protein
MTLALKFNENHRLYAQCEDIQTQNTLISNELDFWNVAPVAEYHKDWSLQELTNQNQSNFYQIPL